MLCYLIRSDNQNPLGIFYMDAELQNAFGNAGQMSELLECVKKAVQDFKLKESLEKVWDNVQKSAPLIRCMRTQDSVNVIRMGNYGDLAREYYDSVRHPTCANFREASRRLLISWLSTLALSGAHLLEVGAGASIVSEWLSRNGRILDRFIVTDLSSKMLQYSHNHVIDQRIVCDASKTAVYRRKLRCSCCVAWRPL